MFKAKWNYRKGNYETARALIQDLKIKPNVFYKTYNLYEDYVLLKSDIDYKLGDFNIELENKELANKPDIDFKIKLLLQKSSKLRKANKIKHSFATGLYALKLSSNRKPDNKYIPEFYHAINLSQEYDVTLASKFFIKAMEICNDKFDPYCRKIHCLAILLAEDQDLKNRDLSYLVDENQHFKVINDFIKNYIKKDLSIEEKMNAISLQKRPCTDNFFFILLLIDDLLSMGKYDVANNYIKLLDNCKLIDKTKSYQVVYRKMNYFWHQYKRNRYEQDLDSVILNINLLSKLAEESFGESDNLHYADFLFETNSIHFEVFEILNRQNNPLVKDADLLGKIIAAKKLNNKILGTQVVFEGKDIPTKIISHYSSILSQIEKLELGINEYKDAFYPDMETFEKLYMMYEKLYIIEQKIKEYPNKSEYKNQQNHLEFNRFIAENNIQILDILATHEKYFFSFIRPDTIIIEGHDRTELDSLIQLQLDSIQNKKEASSYSHELIYRIISSHLDSTIKNLIIIPDRNFSIFPFGQVKKCEKANTCNFFSKAYNISYHYNLDAIPISGNNEINPKIALFSYTSQETKRSDYDESQQRELEFGLEEVMSIDTLYNHSKLNCGSKFNRTHFLAQLNSPIVHISTHSESNVANLLDNYLYIRTPKQESEKIYGFEIKNKALDDNLVILSSCNSGTGSYKPGAGTFSLSRDFLQAGAQTVIKSLWAVDDVSTKRLMTKFHQYFIQGNSVSESLRKAKSDLIKMEKYSHPYYWAGFVVEGNAQVKLQAFSK